MFGRKKSRVLVVGAGPTGLVSALVLEKRGIHVDIIDRAWRGAQRDNPVALQPGSIRAFVELGVGSALLSSANPLDALEFYQGTEFQEELLLRTLSSKYPFLVVSQSKLEDTLSEHLRRQFKRKIKWNHQLAALAIEEDHARAEIERMGKQSTGSVSAHTDWVIEKTLHEDYEFVIGADGYDSVVRRSLGVPWKEIGPAEEYAIFEVAAKEENDAKLRVVFDGPHSSVLWPMPRERWQWAFQIPVDQERHDREKSRFSFDIDQDSARREFAALVTQRAPWFAGWSADLVWSAKLRFERRLVGQLGAKRCWLVGDAAHLATPIDIHSTDLELLEAQRLATRIADVLEGKASLQALEAFGRAEETRWERLIVLENEFAPDEHAPLWVRENWERITRCLPATGKQLVSLAGQLSLELHHGA